MVGGGIDEVTPPEQVTLMPTLACGEPSEPVTWIETDPPVGGSAEGETCNSKPLPIGEIGTVIDKPGPAENRMFATPAAAMPLVVIDAVVQPLLPVGWESVPDPDCPSAIACPATPWNENAMNTPCNGSVRASSAQTVTNVVVLPAIGDGEADNVAGAMPTKSKAEIALTSRVPPLAV